MSLLQSLLTPLTRSENTSCDRTETESTAAHTVRPAYRIQESPDAFNVTVQLPGVTKDGLEISADHGELSIIGRRSWKTPEAWTALYRETSDASYSLTLRHESAVAVEKVVAELRDGVLTLTLPKSEALKPRKIAVS